jgi:hypothetical protein
MECFGIYYTLSVVRAAPVLSEGAKYGFLIWQFFVFPAIAVHYLFDKRPMKHLLLISGHHLVATMIEGAVIAALK